MQEKDPMARSRVASLIVLLLSLLVCTPTVWAQSSISGAVRDASGAVLPGVTVEAASPALIEKVRSVVTDTQGVYRIVDLRPGPYTVTFTLPGFNTFKRDGIELRAEFTATVDAELIPPNSVFEPRLTQVDFRFSRIFRLGGTTRLRGNLDIYKVFNASNVLSMTTTYGPAWRNVAHTRGPHRAFCARWGRF
jgi:hypothetical protein